ncbi:beta/alpha barrel domain-containing protein [Mucilaginibacter segetis]|uniref:Bifunctional 4-hydroxy-2-oxoglutarate aldolase/2-dehydro-3-deoxy-phosphogluconate aldolase n=1 Tax=Mucilaginibacter segetis TaxID=2793071 RepID=A0A934PU85_9SPHI|nr:bifunctional 4-hydroxy-2-oxoglutarate aldolase/2-dehydro-3-deoxy-phosphogluconate aldolase [Mucilaginibacter segetis]MBK0379662.1 bifunctional 4-hydroxy-2-oxoglutarate aldolase/2-dehydro-3-deoxy-phosphogluconate aldolase [Mucilaginibacter segetis]
MMTKEHIKNSIIKQGLLPLFYDASSEGSIAITRALYKAGIRVIEYTNRGANAEGNFAILKKLQQTELPDMLLGIGTVKSKEEATRFINVGADFIIAPLVNPDVATIAQQHDLLWIPGCMTPTEIYKAQLLGATMVKLFPSNILGPGFLSAVKDIFPELAMMPTGGVEMSQQNIGGWFNAGASAVGMGSKLITQAVLENKAYDQLYTEALRAIQLVNNAR